MPSTDHECGKHAVIVECPLISCCIADCGQQVPGGLIAQENNRSICSGCAKIQRTLDLEARLTQARGQTRHEIERTPPEGIPSNWSQFVSYPSDDPRSRSHDFNWHQRTLEHEAEFREEESAKVEIPAVPSGVGSLGRDDRILLKREANSSGQPVDVGSVDLRGHTMDLPIRPSSPDEDWVIVEDEWALI